MLIKTKKSSGFTMLEILLSSAILASAIYVINGQQLRAYIRVIFLRGSIQRLFLVKKYWYERYITLNDSHILKRLTKKEPAITIDYPEVKIRSEPLEFEKNALFADLEKCLVPIRTSGEWEHDDDKRVTEVIGFVCKPKPEEPDENEKENNDKKQKK